MSNFNKVVFAFLLAVVSSAANAFSLELTQSPKEGVNTGIKLGGSGDEWGGSFIWLPTDDNLHENSSDFVQYSVFDCSRGLGDVCNKKQDVYVNGIYGFEVVRIFRKSNAALDIGGALLFATKCDQLDYDGVLGEDVCHNKGGTGNGEESETILAGTVGLSHATPSGRFKLMYNSFYGISVGWEWKH